MAEVETKDSDSRKQEWNGEVSGIVRKELLGSGIRTWKLPISNTGANIRNLRQQEKTAHVLYDMVNIRLLLKPLPLKTRHKIVPPLDLTVLFCDNLSHPQHSKSRNTCSFPAFLSSHP